MMMMVIDNNNNYYNNSNSNNNASVSIRKILNPRMSSRQLKQTITIVKQHIVEMINMPKRVQVSCAVKWTINS